MNIREWFGFNGEYDATLDINSCVDGLLELYVNAIKTYFSSGEVQSYSDLLSINQDQLNSGQRIFLKWLKEEGFPFLNKLCTQKLPNDKDLIAKIDYDKYILEEEMDFMVPDDVRSSLISIVTDIPEYIQSTKETSVSKEAVSSSGRLTVNGHLDELETIFSVITEYDVQETNYPTGYFIESAVKAGFLFLRRNIIGNIRILQIY